jgi:hypothetical protein
MFVLSIRRTPTTFHNVGVDDFPQLPKQYQMGISHGVRRFFRKPSKERPFLPKDTVIDHKDAYFSDL